MHLNPSILMVSGFDNHDSWTQIIPILYFLLMNLRLSFFMNFFTDLILIDATLNPLIYDWLIF